MPTSRAIRNRTQEVIKINREVVDTINYLCSTPDAHTNVPTKTARAILLKQDTVFCRGSLRRIVAKNIGAGVYRITTKPIN